MDNTISSKDVADSFDNYDAYQAVILNAAWLLLRAAIRGADLDEPMEYLRATMQEYREAMRR